jgi:hypothetical protein
MQGLFIAYQRPRSKKAVKEAVADDPSMVQVEATSMFGDEYDGTLDKAPAGTTIYFVGPDPYTRRNFYGAIEVGEDGALKVT